jgi:hypothetical protein
MTKLVALVVAVAVAVVVGGGCSKKDGAGSGGAAGSCKPLAVTVDGTPLAAMPNGLARSNNMNGDISYEVLVFNHDKATCAELVSKAGRQIPDGEVSVRAFAGGGGMMGKGVGIASHTQAGGDISLVSAKPTAVGDIVKVCVDNVSFSPQVGENKGKKVTITGLFEGKYCGELKW